MANSFSKSNPFQSIVSKKISKCSTKPLRCNVSFCVCFLRRNTIPYIWSAIMGWSPRQYVGYLDLWSVSKMIWDIFGQFYPYGMYEIEPCNIFFPPRKFFMPLPLYTSWLLLEAPRREEIQIEREFLNWFHTLSDLLNCNIIRNAVDIQKVRVSLKTNTKSYTKLKCHMLKFFPLSKIKLDPI